MDRESADEQKVFIKTFGCQMNDYDSERMYRLMERAGWGRAGTPEGADLIVVNTCSVREKAEHKAISEIGWMRRHKKRNPACVLALAGCVAQRTGDTFLKKVPDLDLVIGTHAIDKLPGLVRDCREKRRIAETGWDYERVYSPFLPAPPDGKGRLSWKDSIAGSFITIMRGCDKQCAFCVVPQTRGKEVSRPIEDVVAEARSLVEAGVRDITLLGQIVNRYGRGLSFSKKPIFHELLDALVRIPDLRRLRFTSSHPSYLSDELIEAFRSEPKLASHLHLPVQSGSDRILKAMRRGHDIREYMEVIQNLRRARPGIAITTDIIVGFPGEEEEDFEATLELIREASFDNFFAFKYSPRPGTPAEDWGESLSEDLKAERLKRVHDLAYPMVLKKNQATCGRVMEVIVDGVGRTPESRYGRTSCGRMVHFPAPEAELGDMIPVRIMAGHQNSLQGIPVATG